MQKPFEKSAVILLKKKKTQKKNNFSQGHFFFINAVFNGYREKSILKRLNANCFEGREGG